MTGNGRNLTLVHPVPVQREVAWVPVLDIPMRDDERDLKPTETEKAS